MSSLVSIDSSLVSTEVNLVDSSVLENHLEDWSSILASLLAFECTSIANSHLTHLSGHLETLGSIVNGAVLSSLNAYILDGELWE